MNAFDHAGTSRVLATDKGRIHYHEAGSGPVLLMIHGSGPGVSGWANFQGNLPVFARHFRCVVIDLPGYGGSDPVAGAPVPACVDAVLRLMDGLGIGMNLFTAFPGEGLRLLTAFAEEPTRENIETWLRAMVFDQSIITDELIESRLKAATDPVTLATSRQLYSRASADALAAEFRGPNATQRVAHLAAIQAPTLITWGRDDRVSPLDMALLPMRAIPHAELHVFPNCGHWAMIECKEAFETLVTGFLSL